jgi:nucleoside-diphosphate-sugar epimerase
MHILELSKTASIEQFLYASSGSVYGIKDEEKVTEELELVPISLYNKTKMIAERVLMSYQDHFRCIAVRPATICGYSPRMRFDVLINMLVWQAFSTGKIKVLGGSQIRPNIHIEDVCDVYTHFLENPDLESGPYNAGFENVSVMEAAELVCSFIPAKIEISPTNDPRSYRQDSTKLLMTGYSPRRNIRQAIMDLVAKLEDGSLVDDERWYTVGRMKNLGFGK